MAADVIPGPSRTNAVAENGGLDRLMVSSRRDDLDFAWRGWEIEHRRGTNISRGGRCSQRSARAAVVPAQNMIAFADDGRTPFEKA